MDIKDVYVEKNGGWQTNESFLRYAVKLMDVWRPRPKPILWFLDGHSSHKSPALEKLCAENDIHLLIFYPYTTHVAQPLDLAFFHPLKNQYWLQRKVFITQYKAEHNLGQYDKVELDIVKGVKIFFMAHEQMKATKSQAIVNGFRAAGLFPLDPSAIKLKIKHKKLYDEQIPLISEIHDDNGNVIFDHTNHNTSLINTITKNLSQLIINVGDSPMAKHLLTATTSNLNALSLFMSQNQESSVACVNTADDIEVEDPKEIEKKIDTFLQHCEEDHDELIARLDAEVNAILDNETEPENEYDAFLAETSLSQSTRNQSSMSEVSSVSYHEIRDPCSSKSLVSAKSSKSPNVVEIEPVTDPDSSDDNVTAHEQARSEMKRLTGKRKFGFINSNLINEMAKRQKNDACSDHSSDDQDDVQSGEENEGESTVTRTKCHQLSNDEMNR